MGSTQGFQRKSRNSIFAKISRKFSLIFENKFSRFSNNFRENFLLHFRENGVNIFAKIAFFPLLPSFPCFSPLFPFLTSFPWLIFLPLFLVADFFPPYQASPKLSNVRWNNTQVYASEVFIFNEFNGLKLALNRHCRFSSL